MNRNRYRIGYLKYSNKDIIEFYGDLLCRVIVEVPSTLDKKQLKALEEFSKLTDESKNFPGTDQFQKVFKELD